MSDFASTPEPTGFEPELGGVFRDSLERTGFEPELGGSTPTKRCLCR